MIRGMQEREFAYFFMSSTWMTSLYSLKASSNSATVCMLGVCLTRVLGSQVQLVVAVIVLYNLVGKKPILSPLMIIGGVVGGVADYSEYTFIILITAVPTNPEEYYNKLDSYFKGKSWTVTPGQHFWDTEIFRKLVVKMWATKILTGEFVYSQHSHYVKGTLFHVIGVDSNGVYHFIIGEYAKTLGKKNGIGMKAITKDIPCLNYFGDLFTNEAYVDRFEDLVRDGQVRNYPWHYKPVSGSLIPMHASPFAEINIPEGHYASNTYHNHVMGLKHLYDKFYTKVSYFPKALALVAFEGGRPVAGIIANVASEYLIEAVYLPSLLASSVRYDGMGVRHLSIVADGFAKFMHNVIQSDIDGDLERIESGDIVNDNYVVYGCDIEYLEWFAEHKGWRVVERGVISNVNTEGYERAARLSAMIDMRRQRVDDETLAAIALRAHETMGVWSDSGSECSSDGE